MEEKIQILLSSSGLDVNLSRSFVSIPEAGGVVIFEGLVRNHTRGKEVLRLEFEAYESMAISELQKIAAEAFSRFDLHRISIQHRVGVLGVGELPVVIAVSASHRKSAFESCEYVIDRLKETVPIWKKEIFSDGEEWVSAHP